jgi:hypothetical protein
VSIEKAGGPLVLDDERDECLTTGSKRTGRFTGIAAEPGRYQLRLSGHGGYNAASAIVDVGPADRSAPGVMAMVTAGANRTRGVRIAGPATRAPPLACDVMMVDMGRSSWLLIGLVLGVLGGALWGWLGSGGTEGGDSALGTGLLGAVVGLLVGGVALAVRGRRDRR